MAVELIELRKRFSRLYKPSSTPALVDVPPLRFLMIDGEGAAGDEGFQADVRALYALAYPVKFAAKKELGASYQVMPLQALYESPDGSPAPRECGPDVQLVWRLMILLPDEVPGELVDSVRDSVIAKKGAELARLSDVRVQTFSEGLSVQVLHEGPYAEEPRTLARLFAFAAEKNLAVTGMHHEIYLNDPNKADPAKLKTLLRYGVSAPHGTADRSAKPTPTRRSPKPRRANAESCTVCDVRARPKRR